MGPEIGRLGSALRSGLIACAVIRRGREYIFEEMFLEERKVGEGRLMAGGGERERISLCRVLLFPIARPAALALCVRLPLVPERKPVIVPNFDPFLSAVRAAGRCF